MWQSESRLEKRISRRGEKNERRIDFIRRGDTVRRVGQLKGELPLSWACGQSYSLRTKKIPIAIGGDRSLFGGPSVPTLTNMENGDRSWPVRKGWPVRDKMAPDSGCHGASGFIAL